ncbi:hypothetical protein CHS0354_025743 [Potamilus streckersoni]|uniref:Bromodomain adjacent to zinc finger domain protein 2B n=1 Tax=Potamilus streckersoni TaxID=2493646 RepID=A0AAE0RUD1_9BIVA|nr:hypothetical protein CHS0354_025743 [Potamilus streckersoni]
MEKGDKSSPTPGQNIFSTSSNVLGSSPFSAALSLASTASSLPFAHLTHPLMSFSMLGSHLSPFPVTSLFGGFGDGLPTSTSSVTSTSLARSSTPSSTAGSKKLRLLTSSPIYTSVSMSPKATSTKAATTIATSTTSSSANKTNGTSPTSVTSPTASGRDNSTSLTVSPNSSGRRGRPRKSLKQTHMHLSLLTGLHKPGTSGTSLLSPTQIEKLKKKEVNAATNGFESKDSGSDHQGSNGDSLAEKLLLEIEKRKERKENPTKESSSGASSPSKPTGSQTSIHIDGLKKKLIADQIRQRVQNKTSGSGVQEVSKHRGRGRPPKNVSQKNLSPKELEDQKRRQEDLKHQLEQELKQQQLALRLMKKAGIQKEKEVSWRSHQFQKQAGDEQMLTNIKYKPHQSKLAQALSPEKYDSVPGSSTKVKSSEPLIAKFKTYTNDESSITSFEDSEESESGSESESESTSDSSSDSDDKESEVQETEGTQSHAAKVKRSSGARKRGADSSLDGMVVPLKKRRVQLDEKELKIPLQHGWRRQTNIHTYGRRGIVGEVWYFAPCGRKLKTIPDVMRYLDRNGVTEFGRDNFSFNTKVNVGEFYEARQGQNGFVKLTESEIMDRLSATVNRRKRKMEIQKKQEKLQMQQLIARQLMDVKLRQKNEQQEIARKAVEIHMQKKLEKQRQKELLKRAKQMRAVERRRHMEQLRLMKEHEKIQKQEQLRMEKELRSQQMLESNLLWFQMEQERELKRQQALLVKEQIQYEQAETTEIFASLQERERRRQHLILLKALEQRKKQEERERQKEEKLAEKRISKERKIEQRRMEIVLAQELKKPREDMELRDHKPMPEFPRLEGVRLQGAAYADILMVLEFLHNFADALGYDKTTLPTLKGLQDGVLNRSEDDNDDYLALVSHLLKYAVDDPGVPNPKEAVTKLGQKIADVEINESVVPEILRIFMVARNGKENEVSLKLQTQPLEAFTVMERASVLAFLVNELICSRNITGEIEKHLDHIGGIRRNKWVVEGKLRRLRVIQNKKFKKNTVNPSAVEIDNTSIMGDNSIMGDDSMMTTQTKDNSDDEEKDNNDNDENDNDSGNESDSINAGKDAVNGSEAEEDDPQTAEECEKKIDKLQKQHAQYRENVFQASHKVRAITIGQDRYKRRYWILPVAGGIYVEGMESGDLKLVEEEIEHKMEKQEGKEIKVLSDIVKDEKEDTKTSNKSENDDMVVEEKGKIAGERNDDIKLKEVVKNGNVKCESSEKKVLKCDSFEKDVKCEQNDNVKVNSEEDEKGKLERKSVAKDYDSSGEKFSAKLDIKEEKEKLLCNGEIDSSVTSRGCSEKHKSNSNLFLQEPQISKLSDLCHLSNGSEIKTESKSFINHVHLSSSSSSTSPFPSSPISTSLSTVPGISNGLSHIKAISSPIPPPAHSNKSSTSSKPSIMSIDTILKKDPGPFCPSGSFPSCTFSPDNLPRTSPADIKEKPWFSILPRIPCDDMSLTRGQHQAMGMFNSSPFLSPLSFRAFPMQSPPFASFQMGQLFGSPSDMNISGMSCYNIGSTDNSFKIPDLPGENPSMSQKDPEELLRSLQGEAQPIPEEYKSGWWRITDQEKVRELQKCLHPRGIREKGMQKSLQKGIEYAISSCSKGNPEIISLESSSEEEESEEEEKEKVEKKKEKKSPNAKKENAKSKGKTDSEEEKTKEEELESKKDEQNELELGNNGDKKEKMEETSEEPQKKKKKRKEFQPVPEPDYEQKSHDGEMRALMEVQNLEERVASASLQMKGWKLPHKDEEEEIIIVPRSKVTLEASERYPLEVAKHRLLELESNIERRYLKPPLSKAVRLNLSNLSSSTSSNHGDNTDDHGEDVEETLPPGLQTWRTAVTKATSPAQIMLCIHQIDRSIAWEKSIMKVLCQICRKDNNEAELLLCDGCDRGYHTYCFKPKLENIPEGDWYCFECISKAVGESCCLVCGKRMGKLAECDTCPRAIHIDCMIPPLSRVPRKWSCASCNEIKGKKKGGRKSNPGASKRRRSDSTTSSRDRKDSETSKSEVSVSPEKSDRRKSGHLDKEKRKVVESSADMVICRLILTEMEKHEDGWPFLVPVNLKQFPSYKKIIKIPMDFSTMKNNLRDNCYKTRAEFAADARIIFQNCQTFNEDDSEVGQAGHNMRKFFERRWKELLLSSSSEDVCGENSSSQP